MIYYLIGATDAQGIKDAEERGWVRLARARFAVPEAVPTRVIKDEVRVISRIADLFPIAGGTRMIRGSDYDDGPVEKIAFGRWVGVDGQVGEKEKFDRFVAEGHGKWVEGVT